MRNWLLPESHSVHRDLKPDKIEQVEKLGRDFLLPREKRREVCESGWLAVDCDSAGSSALSSMYFTLPCIAGPSIETS